MARSNNVIPIWDTFTNLVSGLFGLNDKSLYSYYAREEISPDQLEAAFQFSWLARKIVTIPADDSTREWRSWQAEQDQIEKLEEAEEKFNLHAKVREAQIKARLYGGAGIVIGTTTGNPREELDPETIKEGGLKFLHVVTRYELAAGELESNIESPFFGVPRWYAVNAQGTARNLIPASQIHPSRIARFIGNDSAGLTRPADGWGDPVLWAVNDAIRSASVTNQSIAQLIQEAKVDFIKITDLQTISQNQTAMERYLNRMRMVNASKSTTNAVLLDKDDEWNRTQLSFAGMPDVMQTFLMIVCGAADIPAMRMLGRSATGLNATGDNEMRNYYDHIRSDQNTKITPTLATLDKCLQAHALGKVDPDVHYEWSPLWQMDETQKATINKTNSDAAKVLLDTGLIPFSALAKGMQNKLIEEGTYPGLEAALQEAEDAGDFVEPMALSEPMPQPVLPAPGDEWLFEDRDLRSLYVRRDLRNARELRAWAASQGFKDLVSDMHVTVLYSRQPVDWIAMGNDFMRDRLVVPEGGPRTVEKLGSEGAVVLHFACDELRWRHQQMVDAGASDDYGEYQPHVTITYDPGDVDLEKVEPYRGRLIFGPEIFEEIDDGGDGLEDHHPF